MSDLVYTIASTKRKLQEASDKLDEIYKAQAEELRAKKNQLEERYKKLESQCRNFDLDKVALKITQRMIYLGRQDKPYLNDARIDELSRLLDWLEGFN